MTEQQQAPGRALDVAVARAMDTVCWTDFSVSTHALGDMLEWLLARGLGVRILRPLYEDGVVAHADDRWQSVHIARGDTVQHAVALLVLAVARG